MKRVLLYGNRKSDTIVFDVTTPALEAAAYLALFKILDREWQVYEDLKDPLAWDASETGPSARERQIYTKAKAGDAAAAKRLLCMRNGNEYEKWRIVAVHRT